MLPVLNALLEVVVVEEVEDRTPAVNLVKALVLTSGHAVPKSSMNVKKKRSGSELPAIGCCINAFKY